jgi:hypothetical protein
MLVCSAASSTASSNNGALKSSPNPPGSSKSSPNPSATSIVTGAVTAAILDLEPITRGIVGQQSLSIALGYGTHLGGCLPEGVQLSRAESEEPILRWLVN